jgi:hypothetical protein
MKKLLAIAVAASSFVFTTTSASAAVATPTWQTANSVATGDQDGPSIATNRNGYVAVVWEDDRDTTNAADDAHSEIFLRLFRNGTAVYEVKLSAGGSGVTTWRHLHPDVGLDDKGNAVVVWADDPDGKGYYNVPYRVVNTSGTVTASGNANSSSTGQQINPRVAVDPDGAPAGGAVAFTVVWEDIQTGAQAMAKAAGFTGPTTRAGRSRLHRRPVSTTTRMSPFQPPVTQSWCGTKTATRSTTSAWSGWPGATARSASRVVRRTQTEAGSKRTRRWPPTSTATSPSPGNPTTPAPRARGCARSTRRAIRASPT